MTLDLSFFRAVVELSPALVAVGTARDVRYLSPSILSALGWGSSGMPSPLALTHGIVHPDDRDRLATVVGQAAATGEAAAAQIRLRHSDGHFVTVDCVVHDLRSDDHVRGFMVQGWDVSTREEAYQQAALYDPLTGLANRVLFADRLGRALRAQQRHSGRVGVLYIDLDNFKVINDEHGHPTGDAVLQEVAQRLAGAVRPGDTAARLSGDEFAVLCEELADVRAGYDVARRVEEALTPPIRLRGRQVQVRASIGVGLAVDPLIAPDDLIASADADMYREKRRRTPVD